jgi:hypothetical protein
VRVILLLAPERDLIRENGWPLFLASRKGDNLEGLPERRKGTACTTYCRRMSMRSELPLVIALPLSILSMPATALLPASAVAEVACSGHQLLRNPRPESSCSNVKPAVYASPDGALRALVLPADVSLYATPDMESRIVIRTAKGDTLTSKDYSSARGTNGYYVVHARWSPDSQFFVYSMASSGGHSPWSFPMMVYSRQKRRIAGFSDMIDGRPTLSADFHFTGPHILVASTWKQQGSLDDKVSVSVDLEDAFAKLPPASD